jgi:hypothetical protein
MNIENIHKLKTKEDPFHIHKLLGILSLGHFAYRYFNLFYTSMNFTTPYDLYCLAIHSLLSITSLQFKIPKIRNHVSPMIYPEFRLHNLLFSFRSILCTLFFYYKLPIIYNIIVCFVTMACADIVTYYYKDGTTMRDMKFNYNIFDDTKYYITLFHSKMQVCATLYMIGNIDSAFSPLFAIQLSSFLMTLVRKNIIKTTHWHFIYGLSLIINVFAYLSLRLDFILFQLFAFKLFVFLRFIQKRNKYLSWLLVYFLFLLYNKIPYTVMYEIPIKIIIIIIYLYKYLPLFTSFYIDYIHND